MNTQFATPFVDTSLNNSYTRKLQLEFLKIVPSLFHLGAFVPSVVVVGENSLTHVHPIAHDRFGNIFREVVGN